MTDMNFVLNPLSNRISVTRRSAEELNHVPNRFLCFHSACTHSWCILWKSPMPLHFFRQAQPLTSNFVSQLIVPPLEVSSGQTLRSKFACLTICHLLEPQDINCRCLGNCKECISICFLQFAFACCVCGLCCSVMPLVCHDRDWWSKLFRKACADACQRVRYNLADLQVS